MRTSLIGTTILFSLIAFSARAQTPAFTSVANAASLVSGPIAPGMVAVINGSNLAGATGKDCAATYPTPTSCNGASVLVNGKAAPVSFAVANQIAFQVPFEITGSTATIQVTSQQQNGSTLSSAVLTVPVAAVAPGLYSASGTGSGLGYYFVPGGLFTQFSGSVQMGQTVVIYGTGFGITSPAVADGNPSPDSPLAICAATVTLTVGNKPAVVQSASLEPVDSPARGAPGADQVVFTVPTGLAAGSYPVVVTVGGQNSQPVQITIQNPPVGISSVINAAGYGAGVESGSWISIKGQNLAATTRTWQTADFVGNAFPTIIDGVTVTVNGKSAFVYYVSPTQLNVLAPTDTALGLVQVVVKNVYGSAESTALLQQYAPAFFPLSQPAGVAANAPVYVAAVHASDGAYVVPTNYYPGYPSRSAQPGELLEIYGTGFGPTTPAVTAGQFLTSAAPVVDLTQLHLSIGGVPATVQFAGIVPPGDEYQFNVVVPQLPDGDQTLTATIGGQTSQTGISIPIKN